MIFPLSQRKIIRGFQAHIDAGMGGAVDYRADHDGLRSPKNGSITSYWGSEGGNWISIKFDDGYVMKCAHLDSYIKRSGRCLAGEITAITGNTGKPRDGRSEYPPHAHIETYDPQGRRIDPEKYFITNTTMTIYKIVYLSDTDDIGPQITYCNQKLREFSGGALNLEYRFHQMLPVHAAAGFDLDQFLAMGIVDGANVSQPFHSVILGYYGQNSSQGYATTTTNKGIEMSWGYKPWPQHILLYELGHQLIRTYNRNRGSNPYIENSDNYKEGDIENAVRVKVQAIMPYLHLLTTAVPTEQEMRLITLNGKDVWLVSKNGKKSLVYNLLAFQLVDGNIDLVEKLNQAQFDAIPDSGNVLAGLPQ